MRRSVIHDPEHGARFVVGRLAHDLLDQPPERCNAGRCLAAPEHFRPVHIQGGQIGPGTAARILVLHAHGLARRSGKAWMPAHTRLDAGLLVGGDDEFVLAQCPPLPGTGIQVQDAPGLGLEMRIARKDPAAVLPRANRVLVQPAPDRAIADACHQSRAFGLARHIGHAQPRQRQPRASRQLTSQRLDLNDELWGEKPAGDLGGLVPPGPPIALCRSAFATD